MKSARINFGQPNTEYKLEINEAGEATSCYNQDTDTEYIGGGGGGDLSIAVVEAIRGETSYSYVPIQVPCAFDDGIDISNGLNYGENNIPLYKGSCYAYRYPNDVDMSGFTVTGNITVKQNGSIIISGNGTISYSDPV